MQDYVLTFGTARNKWENAEDVRFVFEKNFLPVPVCLPACSGELSNMSDGYDLEPQDDVVAAPAPASSQPAANATWTLTDLRHGSSNWSLASDCGVRLFPFYYCPRVIFLPKICVSHATLCSFGVSIRSRFVLLLSIFFFVM